MRQIGSTAHLGSCQKCEVKVLCQCDGFSFNLNLFALCFFISPTITSVQKFIAQLITTREQKYKPIDSCQEVNPVVD